MPVNFIYPQCVDVGNSSLTIFIGYDIHQNATWD